MSDQDNSYDLAGSTGDYQDLDVWFAAVDDIAGTHTLRVKAGTHTDTLTVNDNSFTATGFIIKPYTGASHDGRSRSVSGVGAEFAGTAVILIWWFVANAAAATLVIQDICLRGTGYNGVVIGTADAANVTIKRCVFLHEGTSSGCPIALWGAGGTSSNNFVYDNVVISSTTNASGFGIDARSNTGGAVVGNTVDGTGAGGAYGILFDVSTTVACKNNISVRWANGCFFNDDTGDNTNNKTNIASDATANAEYGSSSINSVNVYEEGDTPSGDYVAFKDLGTDYRLVTLVGGSGSNKALNTGTASVGSGYSILRATRDSAPCIGADEQGVTMYGGGTITIGTGKDVATLHAFEQRLADITPISGPIIGAVANEIVRETADTIFGYYGQTTSYPITLQPDTGCGFADLHDYSTDPLDYDASAGAGFDCDGNPSIAITFGTSNMTIQDLQWYLPYVTGIQLGIGFVAPAGDGNNAGPRKFQRNIVRLGSYQRVALGGFSSVDPDVLIANNLIIQTDVTNSTVYPPLFLSINGFPLRYAVHNTVVIAHNSSSNATQAIGGIYTGFSGTDIVYLFGNAAYVHDTTHGAPFLESNDLTTSLDYNVQNGVGGLAGADTLPGAHTSTSGNGANDFEDWTATSLTDAVDFRPKVGSLLIGFIPEADAFSGSGLLANAADLDIRKQSRVGADYDAGCFQTFAASVPQALTASLFVDGRSVATVTRT